MKVFLVKMQQTLLFLNELLMKIISEIVPSQGYKD